MTDPVYRFGTVADLPLIMTVMEDAFEPCFGEAWNAAQCSGILGLPGVGLLLASVGGVPAGFALTRVVLDEAELLLLAVSPARRRHGIGEGLLRRAAEAARIMGAARLHLEVRDGNPAISLYKRSGFAQVGRRTGYYRGRRGELFDALSLSIALDHRNIAHNSSK